MVVECRKVNLKICFSSNLQLTIEHAFQLFLGACFIGFGRKLYLFSESIHSPGAESGRFYTPVSLSI